MNRLVIEHTKALAPPCFQTQGSKFLQLQLVAAGLYEALFTTAFGLIIAVAATIAAHIFRQFIDTYELEQEHALAAVEATVRLS